MAGLVWAATATVQGAYHMGSESASTCSSWQYTNQCPGLYLASSTFLLAVSSSYFFQGGQ